MTDPRRVDTLGRCALFALVALFALLAARQLIRPALAARKELRDFREAVAILTETEGDVDRLNAEIRQVARQVAESEALLPPQPNLDAFLEHLGALANDQRVHIETLTPQATTTHRLYREQEIDVRATGPFLALYRFLRALEHGPHLTRITRLEITRGTDGGACAAEIRLALYFAPAERSST